MYLTWCYCKAHCMFSLYCLNVLPRVVCLWMQHDTVHPLMLHVMLNMMWTDVRQCWCQSVYLLVFTNHHILQYIHGAMLVIPLLCSTAVCCQASCLRHCNGSIQLCKGQTGTFHRTGREVQPACPTGASTYQVQRAHALPRR